jgi:hypothetical protein
MPAHAAPRGVRVVQLARGAGLLLAVPMVLALGAASVATFIIGATALVLAPHLRGRGAARDGTRQRTITLGRGAYRRLDDPTDLALRERR